MSEEPHLMFIRKTEWVEIKEGEPAKLVVSTVVSVGFMGFDTIVGYIVKTPNGYQRIWEEWL